MIKGIKKLILKIVKFRNTYMTESIWQNEYDQNLVKMTEKIHTDEHLHGEHDSKIYHDNS